HSFRRASRTLLRRGDRGPARGRPGDPARGPGPRARTSRLPVPGRHGLHVSRREGRSVRVAGAGPRRPRRRPHLRESRSDVRSLARRPAFRAAGRARRDLRGLAVASRHRMSEGSEIVHADGRVELADASALASSRLYNEDLAPIPVSRRNWTTYNYAALWISMAHCIPTYMLASGLMSQGMSWKQALFTILLGNTIVLVPILLNSHPGTKYGIPFPVFARAAYGTAGSNLPALMRALVACG